MQTVDRQQMAMELKICKDKAVENLIFCKQHYFDCLEQVKLSDSYHEVYRQLKLANDNRCAVEVEKESLAKQNEEMVQRQTI